MSKPPIETRWVAYVHDELPPDQRAQVESLRTRLEERLGSLIGAAR